MSKSRGRIAALVAVLAVVLLFAGPRAGVDGDWRVPEIGPDVGAYIRASEAMVPDLRPGDGKRIVWADTATRSRTPLALVYLHGFSADPHEVEPLVSSLARDLGANAYIARLAGHGRTEAAMGEVEADDWLGDAAEAMAVGGRLGERVVLMGTSTGGTLAAWVALQPALSRSLAAVVLLSPNFQPADRASRMLLWPWGGSIARLVVGPERCFETHNAEHARHWTSCYPTSALLPMMALVEHVRTADLGAARVPLLVAYAPGDRIVDTGEIRDAFERWGTPAKRLIPVPTTGDPDRHVLAGDILSPGTTELVRAAVLDFLEGPGGVLPPPIENRPRGHYLSGASDGRAAGEPSSEGPVKIDRTRRGSTRLGRQEPKERDGMLRVPTVVAPSSIEGVGLFTTHPLAAGTIIWDFTPGVDWRIPVADFQRFPDPYRSWLLRYVYREPSGFYVLCGDNAKFMNHSFEPNCDDVDGPFTVARRDIDAGEELTCDYRLFDLDSVEGEELMAYR